MFLMILQYTLHHTPPCHICIYIWPFFKDGVFILWICEEVLDNHASFKVHLYPMFASWLLDVVTQPFGIRNHHVWILVVVSVVSRFVGASSVVVLGWAWVLIFILLRVHAGYLHFVRALNGCCSSCCNSWGLEHVVFALWCRVPTTLYLDDIVWWLSHCKYKSVWVGFLYTDVLRLPSSFGVTRAWNHLFWNLHWWIEVFWSMELTWSRKLLLWAVLMTVNASSTYHFHKEGGLWWCIDGFDLKIPHI